MVNIDLQSLLFRRILLNIDRTKFTAGNYSGYCQVSSGRTTPMGIDAFLYSAAATSQDQSPRARHQLDTVTVMSQQHGPNIAGEIVAQDSTRQEGTNVVNQVAVRKSHKSAAFVVIYRVIV